MLLMPNGFTLLSEGAAIGNGGPIPLTLLGRGMVGCVIAATTTESAVVVARVVVLVPVLERREQRLAFGAPKQLVRYRWRRLRRTACTEWPVAGAKGGGSDLMPPSDGDGSATLTGFGGGFSC